MSAIISNVYGIYLIFITILFEHYPKIVPEIQLRLGRFVFAPLILGVSHGNPKCIKSLDQDKLNVEAREGTPFQVFRSDNGWLPGFMPSTL